MSKNKALAADYFVRHNSSDECHITSDGRVFHQKGTADSFATGLSDKTVESFIRAEMQITDGSEQSQSPVEETPKVEAPVEGSEQSQSPVDEAPKVVALAQAPIVETPTEEAPKVETPTVENIVVNDAEPVTSAPVETKAITLADFNPETTTYNEAFALVKMLGLTTETNKKEDVFAALTAEIAKQEN